MARFTTTTANDKEIRVNVDNVRCLYLGRSGLTEIVFDGEHQVAVKDKMETLVSKTPAIPALWARLSLRTIFPSQPDTLSWLRAGGGSRRRGTIKGL